MIIYLLPESSKQLLIDNDVISISTPYSNEPLFNYISYYSHFPITLIKDMGRTMIEDENYSQKYKEKYKILEIEIYKLFINNCKNITEFDWETTLPLYQYPGASTFFSQLHTLKIDSLFSIKLFEMAEFCQNIEELEVWDCDNDIPGLIKLVDSQNNLNSLAIYCQEIASSELSEAIEKKASLLKKLAMKNVFITPESFPLLNNLEYFKISYYNYDEQKLQELQKYLSISSFRKLQYLFTEYLPLHEVSMLIENSHGNIKTMRIWNYKYFYYAEELFKAIAKNCPNLESLNINIEFEDLNGIKEILLGCTILNKLHLHIDIKDDIEEEDDIEDEGEENCDEILIL